MSRYIQASPTSSYAQEISSEAYDRMQCIWIKFVGGVKSLYDFVICLHEPVFNRNKLQTLSDNARKQISLAEKNIRNGEIKIKNEIYRLVEQKQKIGNDMEDTNNQIISLLQTIRIKGDEIKRANNDIQSAERAVDLHEKKKKKAKTKATVAKVFSGAVAVVGGVATVGVTVLTAGLAAPAAATGVFAAVSGVSAIATGVTHSNLNDAKKALQEKTCILQELQKDLNVAEKKFKDAEIELQRKKERLRNIELQHNTNLDDCKVITKLKSCVSRCHDYINITLGGVEILFESKKVERCRTNLKIIMKEVINHLSGVSSIEALSKFTQQVEKMAIEMSSLCNQQLYHLIQIDCNIEEEMSCSKRSCCVFNSCIGLSLSLMRCFFCGFRNFNI